jgi:hypothetical protein
MLLPRWTAAADVTVEGFIHAEWHGASIPRSRIIAEVEIEV